MFVNFVAIGNRIPLQNCFLWGPLLFLYDEINIWASIEW